MIWCIIKIKEEIMTVKDLKEKLNEFDDDLDVGFYLKNQM